MRVLFDDEVAVAFRSFSFESDAGDDDDGEREELDSRGGQVNGICGAAIPGVLEFTTGLHTGDVPVRIEVHDSEPEADPVWQEVVEVSFRPRVPGVCIGIWADAPIPLPDLEVRDYRTRFCGVGFDNDDDGITDPPERYLLQFWPALPAPDVIVRQTSSVAAYWHRVAQQTPAPPSAEERAAARQQKRAEQERQRREEHERFRRADEARYWGGRAPDSDSLRDIAPRAVGLARIDRDLVDEIAAAGPVSQRAMAAWAARETCRRAGMAELAWVSEALDALDRGEPPPASFATFDDAFARWHGVSPEEITHHATVSVGARSERPRIAPEVSAMHAVVFAREDNPLEAAVDTVKTAAEVIPEEKAAVIAAFRARFALPQPSTP